MILGIPEINFISKTDSLINAFERYYKYSLKPKVKTPHKISFINIKSQDRLWGRDDISMLDYLVKLSDTEIDNLPNLILVIDLFSLEDDEIKLIKELVITYPEVKFVFVNFCDTKLSALFFKELNNNKKDVNESSNKKENVPPLCEKEKNNCQSGYNNELEKNLNKILKIDYNIHNFNILDDQNTINEFNLILKGKYNLFDASYLRTALKISKLDSIGFNNNFCELLNKRLIHLAYSVDEEKNQCLSISYALYKYGFRVLPITSYFEIDNIEQKKASNMKIFIDPNLIVRDWDIQFEDYPQSNDLKTDYVNKMRGFFYDEDGKNYSGPGWYVNNLFWKNFEKIPVFIFSRLTQTKAKDIKYEPILVEPRDKLWYTNESGKYPDCNNQNNASLKPSSDKEPELQGITKPLDGLNEIEGILKVINNSSEKMLTSYELPLDKKPFNRKRINKSGGHSIPPDIYHIGESLLRRAQKYYDKKMYLLSAILSQESIEIINGLHNDLYLDALYLKHISEVSLETDNLGLSNLKKSANKRLFEIQKEAKRIGENEKAIKDFLSQIFNDIRHLYKEKEQFDAAEEVLKEFITINHGFNISLTLESIKSYTKKIKEGINTLSQKNYLEKIKGSINSLSKKIYEKLKSLYKYLIWFYRFGWILIPYCIVVFIIFQINTNNIENFPIWFTAINLIILFIFIVVPKLHLISLVYTLVGRAPSLRYLIVSIALSHIFFSLVFSNYINSTKEVKKIKNTFKYSIPLNLLYTTFSMQASPDFEKIINPVEDNNENDNSKTLEKINSINQNLIEKNERRGFLTLLINYLVLVYSYLGIFISTLYQKLKKE